MSAPAGALKGSLGGAKSLFWEKRTGHGPVVRRASTPLVQLIVVTRYPVE